MPEYILYLVLYMDTIRAAIVLREAHLRVIIIILIRMNI